MRDLLPKPKAAAYSSGEGSSADSVDSSNQVDSEKKKILHLIIDDISSALLEVSFQRMLKKEKVPPGLISFTVGPLELWSDEFEGKGDFGQYRSKLLELIKLTAAHKPLISSSKISERVITLIKNLLASPAPLQDVAVMDIQQLTLDCIVASGNDF